MGDTEGFPWGQRGLGFRTFCLILALTVLALTDVRAQSGAWKRKADLPTWRSCAAAGMIGDTIYVLGGLGIGYVEMDANEAYVPSADTWIKKARLPTPRSLLSSAVIGGVIYCMGGTLNMSTAVEVYDPRTNIWTTKAELLSPRGWAQAAVVDGIIYNIGGNYSDRSCEAYDPGTDRWTRKTERPESGGGLSVTVHEGIIYTFGGSGPNFEPFSTVYAYAPQTDTWTKKASMPTPRYGLQTYLVGGKIYALGGSQAENSAVATVEVYDPLTDQWTERANMPRRYTFCTGAVVNGKIYLFGGSQDWQSGGNELWEYDPSFHTDIAAGSVSGVWSVAHSPYSVAGNITVPNGQTLIVEPGVEIVFAGHYSLNVQGRLLVVGTNESPILFTAETTATGWHGIRFINTPNTNDTSKLVHCSFRYGKANSGDSSSLDRCGGAVMIQGFDKVLVSDCSFEHNMTSGDGTSTGGAAICIFSASPVITGNTFRHNVTDAAGVVKVDFASEAVIRGNLIANNTVSHGSIVCAYSGSANRPTVEGNTIRDNVATLVAGGILVVESKAQIANNVIVHNAAPRGGGVYCLRRGNATFLNNTIAFNKTEGSGAGAYCSDDSDPVFVNTVLSGHPLTPASTVFLEDPGSDPAFQYCNIQGGKEGIGGSGSGVEYTGPYDSNIDVDPAFADTTFQLSDSSFCIGAGADSVAIDGTWYRTPSWDINRFPRPTPPSSHPDIGACESALPYSIYASVLTINPPSYDFHNVHPGSVSDTISIAVANGDTIPRQILSLLLTTSEFAIRPPPVLPTTIPPHGRAEFGLAFLPATPGFTVRDTLRITTTDRFQPIKAVMLTGRGTGEIQHAQPGVLYGISDSCGTIRLYEINKSTGSARLTSPWLGPCPRLQMSAFTVRRADNTLYAAFSSDTATQVCRLSTAHGDAEPYGTFPIGQVTSMAFNSSDALYIVTGTQKMYRIPAPWSDTVCVGRTGHSFTGLAFSPATNALWACESESVFTVDAASAAATHLGATGLIGPHSSIAFSSLGTLYGLFAGSLVTVDKLRGTANWIGLTGVPGLRALAMSDAAMDAAEERDGPAQYWQLDQNYPNPFNAATTIRFGLAEQTHTLLRVYDLLGRNVATLMDEEKPAGSYTVRFDASGLSSGAYICRFQAGPYVQSRKIILTK